MIIGHQKQWDFLKKKFELNQLSHAYLFSGLNELGKKKVAQDLVKLIACLRRQTCLRRQVCQKQGCEWQGQMLEEGRHPDLLMVQPKEGSEIQISQIRAVQQFLSLKPYYTSFKAVIIDKAEKMNEASQNCFLKTLEEPKGNALLILVSSNPAMLLPTILSRCQTIKFFPVNPPEIKNYLINQGVPAKKAEMLADISEGKPGRAIRLALDEKQLQKEKEILNDILKVCGSELALKFQYVKNLAETSFQDVFSGLKRYLRHLLFLKIGIDKLAGSNYFPEVNDKFRLMSISKIKQIMKLIETIDSRLLTTNVSSKLALEILLMEI